MSGSCYAVQNVGHFVQCTLPQFTELCTTVAVVDCAQELLSKHFEKPTEPNNVLYNDTHSTDILPIKTIHTFQTSNALILV